MLHQVKIFSFPGFSQLLLRLVQPVYVALMMLIMMNPHGFFVDVGLQRIIGIGEGRQGVAPDRDRALFPNPGGLKNQGNLRARPGLAVFGLMLIRCSRLRRYVLPHPEGSISG
ncbi:hypothetical protein D3C73_813050 [compost metagenome]